MVVLGKKEHLQTAVFEGSTLKLYKSELRHREAASLNYIRDSMGSQWREARRGEVWSVLESLGTRIAALFWTFCSLFNRYWGQPDRRELQQSRRERTKAESRILWHLWTKGMTDGTYEAELKIGWASQSGDVSFIVKWQSGVRPRFLTEV